jgi:hypothetical protein
MATAVKVSTLWRVLGNQEAYKQSLKDLGQEALLGRIEADTPGRLRREPIDYDKLEGEYAALATNPSDPKFQTAVTSISDWLASNYVQRNDPDVPSGYKNDPATVVEFQRVEGRISGYTKVLESLEQDKAITRAGEIARQRLARSTDH